MYGSFFDLYGDGTEHPTGAVERTLPPSSIPSLYSLPAVTEIDRLSTEEMARYFYDMNARRYTKEGFLAVYDENPELGEIFQYLVLQRLPYEVKNKVIQTSISTAENELAACMMHFHIQKIQNYWGSETIPRTKRRIFDTWLGWLEQRKYYARRARIAVKIMQRRYLIILTRWWIHYAKIRRRTKFCNRLARYHFFIVLCGKIVRGWKKWQFGIRRQIKGYMNRKQEQDDTRLEMRADKHYAKLSAKRRVEMLKFVLLSWDDITHDMATTRKAEAHWKHKYHIKYFNIWKDQAAEQIAGRHQLELDAMERQRWILEYAAEGDVEAKAVEDNRVALEQEERERQLEEKRKQQAYEHKMNATKKKAYQAYEHNLIVQMQTELTLKFKEQREKQRLNLIEERWRATEQQLIEDFEKKSARWILDDARELLYRELFQKAIDSVTFRGQITVDDVKDNLDGRLWTIHYDEEKDSRYFENSEDDSRLYYKEFCGFWNQHRDSNARKIVTENYVHQQKGLHLPQILESSRIKALQREEQENAARVIQRRYRFFQDRGLRTEFRVKAQIRRQKAFEEKKQLCASIIQRRYRTYTTRKKLHLMLQSCYEKRLDPQSGNTYYYNNVTKRVTWDKPSWIKSLPIEEPVGWCSYISPDDGVTVIYCNYTTRETTKEVPKGVYICSACNSHVASKNCESCEKTFCDTCFDEEHMDDLFKRGHSWKGIRAIEIRCVECYRKAHILCNKCEDHYCSSCFNKFHINGARKDHEFSEIGKRVPRCVDCALEATHYCEQCGDEYCLPDFTKAHSKGKRASHVPLPVA
jgi:hypothetical protein